MTNLASGFCRLFVLLYVDEVLAFGHFCVVSDFNYVSRSFLVFVASVTNVFGLGISTVQLLL